MAATNAQALTTKLSSIGDAIRTKTGKTELLTLDDMPTEIAAIETGGGSSGGGGDSQILDFYSALIETTTTGKVATIDLDLSQYEYLPGFINWKMLDNNSYRAKVNYVNLKVDNLRVIPEGFFSNVTIANEPNSNFKITFPSVTEIRNHAFTWSQIQNGTTTATLSFPSLTFISGAAGYTTSDDYLDVFKQSEFDLELPNLQGWSNCVFRGWWGKSKKLYLPSISQSTYWPRTFQSSGIENFYMKYSMAPEIRCTTSNTSAFDNYYIQRVIFDTDTDDIPSLGGPYLNRTAATSTSNVFINGSAYIYVPKRLLSAYETATNWSTFYAAGGIKAIEDSEDELKGIFPGLDERMGWE